MRSRHLLPVVVAVAALVAVPRPAVGYVEVPMSLGSVIQQSVVVCSMVVTKVDKTNNLIIYQKTADIKGKHPQDVIKHNIGRGGLRPGEWKEIMDWAEVGKPAVFFHNGGASETYIGATWYQAYPNGEWWGMSHAEPYLFRSYSGKVDKLPGVVAEMLAGKEVIVPCMVDGDKESIHKRSAKVQRLKASMKIQDYDPKRDFVGWGGEDIRRVAGMPGFDRLAALGRCDPDALAAGAIDFDGDGKPDMCLNGPGRVLLLQNGGDAFSEIGLPGLGGGARSAAWADATGDGRPDLLLATATGPKLYVNLGKGLFRDDSVLLPPGLGYHPAAAVWGDFDADGKPDGVLSTRFDGLRLLRNNRPADAAAKSAPPTLGDWHAVGPFRHKDGPHLNFEFTFPPETEKAPDLAKEHKGKRDMPVKWQKGAYPDGTVNSLAPFGNNCAVYLTRTITVGNDTLLPASFGSDDGLVVWLNGEKLVSENGTRACAPDSNRAVLKLKKGTNHLLLKVTQVEGEFAFYFQPGQPGFGGEPWFTDVSTAWGVGPAGVAGDRPGGPLTVADFDRDGKPDVLLSAGPAPLLLLNRGGRFEPKTDCGLTFAPGKTGPAVADFDGDGAPDVLAVQPDGAVKLFKNDGTGKFADVTAQSGDLAKPVPGAVGAAWGDSDGDGKPDLLVSVLRGPNRYFRNDGKGAFADRTGDIGLSQKVFNTRGAAWADVNGDGQADLLLANEGQDSVLLFGVKQDRAAAQR